VFVLTQDECLLAVNNLMGLDTSLEGHYFGHQFVLLGPTSNRLLFDRHLRLYVLVLRLDLGLYLVDLTLDGFD
jgi:hypothetical protein